MLLNLSAPAGKRPPTDVAADVEKCEARAVRRVSTAAVLTQSGAQRATARTTERRDSAAGDVGLSMMCYTFFK